MLNIGIMGLPGAGKTTVFNVLAKAHAEVAAYSNEPNRAVVKVPDERLEQLRDMFQPKKFTPAEIQYVDVAGLIKGGAEESSAALLGHLRTADVLLHVVRAFGGPLGESQPLSDVETMDTELSLADLLVVDKRYERLEKETRLGRGTPAERQRGERELELLRRIKEVLEAGEPIRKLGLSEDEEQLLRGYGFLTAKPRLVVLNTLEPDESLVEQVKARSTWPQSDVVALAGKLEMELGELEEEEAAEFMRELGITESGISRVIQKSYALARLHSFFTVGADEVRAWTVRQGASAVDAAGAIHTDLARGFIRAEVIHWQTLLEDGSLPEARKRGHLRSEGKSYVVQDGDILNILFNV